MKIKLYRIVLFGVCFFTTLQLDAQVLDLPVATVKLTRLENISQKELKKKVALFEGRRGRSLSQEELEALLDEEIYSILLLQAAERSRISVSREDLETYKDFTRRSIGVELSDSDYRAFIEKESGISYREYEATLKKTIMIERYVISKSPFLRDPSNFTPSKEEAEAYYEKHAVKFALPALTRFTHLFVGTGELSDSEIRSGKAKITELRRKISTGQATFETLLDDSLDDPEYSGEDAGYFTRGEERLESILGESFLDSVFSLEEGAISTVLESKAGFHIIKITDKRPPRLLQIDDPVFPGERVTVRDEIVKLLTQEQQQKRYADALKAQIAELKKDAEIRVFKQNLNWD